MIRRKIVDMFKRNWVWVQVVAVLGLTFGAMIVSGASFEWALVATLTLTGLALALGALDGLPFVD